MKITPKQIIEIEKETNEGKSAKEIAELLGITVGMVEYQRKKHGWKSKYDPNILNKYFDEIKDLVQKEFTDKYIAKLYNCDSHTVAKFRKKHNIERRNLKLCPEKEISQNIVEFLIGSVLGDTSIIYKGKSSRIICQHSIKQEKYLLHKVEILKDLEPKIIYRNNTNFPAVGFYTKGTPSLNYLYNSFYKDGIKIIPFNLLDNFTERSLAYLFMDDGFPVGGKNGHICSVGFALCNFTDEELNKFSDFLKERFDLNSYIIKHYNKHYDKYYSNLIINSSSFNQFQNLIKPYIQDWACYKLGDS